MSERSDRVAKHLGALLGALNIIDSSLQGAPMYSFDNDSFADMELIHWLACKESYPWLYSNNKRKLLGYHTIRKTGRKKKAVVFEVPKRSKKYYKNQKEMYV
jgi:hypothetical protein